MTRVLGRGPDSDRTSWRQGTRRSRHCQYGGALNAAMAPPFPFPSGCLVRVTAVHTQSPARYGLSHVFVQRWFEGVSEHGVLKLLWSGHEPEEDTSCMTFDRGSHESLVFQYESLRFQPSMERCVPRCHRSLGAYLFESLSPQRIVLA